MREELQPFRRVRVEELRRLGACERGLAESLQRWARKRTPVEAGRLERLSSQCEAHARRLDEEVRALGGQVTDEIDRSWILSEDPGDAVDRALATWRDHLDDFDEEMVLRVFQRIVEDHREALRWWTRF